MACSCWQLCNQHLTPALVWIEECSRVAVFKTLVCSEVEWILSAQPNGQHVRLLTRQLLLSSAFLPSCRLSHAFFSVMHARSFSLIFPFHCKLSLWRRRSRRRICQPYGSARGVRSRCAQHWGSAPSSTHTHTHTHTHKHTGLRRACYQGRGH